MPWRQVVRIGDADPVGEIGGLYEKLGWALPEEVRASMRRYLAAKPRGAHGVHRYSAEEMGLDPEALRQRFGFYGERYDVPDETGS